MGEAVAIADDDRVEEFVFDLETTGLHADADIISIAAKHLHSGALFYSEIRPRRLPLSRTITRITGLTTAGLKTKLPWDVEGLRFVRWMASRSRFSEPCDTLLIGHNVRRFDVPLLFRHVERLRVDAPLLRVKRLRILDTLSLSRSVFPMLKNHRQATVYAQLFGQEPEQQHDAVGDVVALAKMLEHEKFKRASARKTSIYDARKVHAEAMRACEEVITSEDKNHESHDIRHYMSTATPVATKIEQPVARSKSPVFCTKCGTRYSPFFPHECRSARRTL